MRRAALLLAVVTVIGLSALVFFPQSGAPDEAAYRLNNVGVARLEQFDYDAAEQSFRQALAIEPRLDMSRLNRAIALLHAGKLDEAEADARAASSALPDSPNAQYVLGLVLRNQNRLDEAIAAFTRVSQIDATDAGTAVNLGQILQEQRKYPEAASQFRRAIDAEAYNVTAAYGLATALARAGRADESATALARFEALRNSAYGTTFSQRYLEQGRYAEAVGSTGLERELVDESTPAVAFTDATTAALGSAADPLCESMTLSDLDGDGDLDLALLSGTLARVLTNDGGRFSAGAEMPLAGTRPRAMAGGDFDNDGRTDLFVAGEPAHRLFVQRADGTFADLSTATPLPEATAGAAAVTPVDIDHDGDLDVVIGDRAQLVRNNGNGTFSDITAETGVGNVGGPVQAIVATDFDNRRDIDLLVVSAGLPPALYRNLRDGRFRDVAAEVGLPGAGAYSAVAAGDVNKDELTDFFLGRQQAPGVLVMSRSVDRFDVFDAPPATASAAAAMFVDYDNDGLLDLLVVTAAGPRLWRRVADRWVDVSARAFAAPLRESGGMTALAMGDLDGDGDTDAVVRLSSGRLRVLDNDGGATNRSLRVRLVPRVSNRSAAGARIDVRAGSLRQRLDVSPGTPAAAPADLVFGLGQREAADVVRVLWPAGILQAETAAPGALTMTELDRKPSSCPLLYTWNGSRFEFVTDFLGGGEMGLWTGPGTWAQPDPDEYVRIRGDQLRPLNNRYEIRVTNELEEATFIDRLELLAVDHADNVSVFPNEGLKPIPDPFRLFTVQGPRPPVAAADDHGHDVRTAIASLDGDHPDDFALSPITGYARPHTLTLDLGAGADRPLLLLTGWTDYAFSSDNVAAHQAGIVMTPPYLQVRDADGRWRTAIENIGFPVGLPQTIVVDLAGKFSGPSRAVRIVTNMRVYWDQILVDPSAGTMPTRVSRAGPVAADLAWRGFSAAVTDSGAPPRYDYRQVTSRSPWKAIAGEYTRVGDVRALVEQTDDMFVVSMPGDQIAASFDVSAFPPVPPGRTRTFLLYADGFSKEMNPRSATPDRLGPMPFHGMTRYPYGPDEAYPSTPAHREYLSRYLTRRVGKPVPPIETSVDGHRDY